MSHRADRAYEDLGGLVVVILCGATTSVACEPASAPRRASALIAVRLRQPIACEPH